MNRETLEALRSFADAVYWSADEGTDVELHSGRVVTELENELAIRERTEADACGCDGTPHYLGSRKFCAVKSNVPKPEAVEALYQALIDESWTLPFMVRARDYPDPASLKAADQAAERNNKKAVALLLLEAGRHLP